MAYSIVWSTRAIAIYKLTTLNRTKVEAMLGINLEGSRIYQEIKAEGKLQLVPLLLELGLTPAQIAERTELDLEKIQQAIAQDAQPKQAE